MITGELTIAERLIASEERIYQLRQQRAANQMALEDALSRDRDVEAIRHGLALADAQIGELEAMHRGLQRRRVLEKLLELQTSALEGVVMAESAEAERAQLRMLYDKTAAEFESISRRLDLAAAARERAGTILSRRRQALNQFQSEHAEAITLARQLESGAV